MSEQRIDIELRAELTALLDRQDGPHPRWAAAPAAARIASSEARPRWPVMRLAGALAASLAIVVLAVVVTSQSGRTPAASGGPTAAPWPSAVPAGTTPSVGEVGLGQVAVATSDGHPAVLVRVSPESGTHGPLSGTHGPSRVYRVEFRVVGTVTARFGIDRLVVVRNGGVTSQRFGDPSAADPLEILPGTPVGIERSILIVIYSGENENIDLGFIGAGTQPAFWFPIHRVVIPSVASGSCPTLADYQAAAALPSMTPALPSFAPVASNTPSSSGVLTPGQVGIVAAPDGNPGALVRVSNVRFCDRLPDVRPEKIMAGMPGDYEILLADVELKVLKSGSLDEGFIPGVMPVRAKWGRGRPSRQWTTTSREASGGRRLPRMPALPSAGRWPGSSARTGSEAAWRSRSDRRRGRGSSTWCGTARRTGSAGVQCHQSRPLRRQPLACSNRTRAPSWRGMARSCPSTWVASPSLTGTQT